jgi:hypothetical protein
MKRFAVLIVVAFMAAMALSSCNREVCPAYSNAENVQTEHAG